MYRHWLWDWNMVKNPKIQGGGILGIDGDYVPKEYLVIDKDEFMACDLEKRLDINKQFDLAISLEVAEHLSKGRAESFIEDLCKLSHVVLFSAAFPGQGGVKHINEQPLSYWNQIFEKNEYRMFDLIRPQIWHDGNIDYWYKNNMALWVKRGSKEEGIFDKYESPQPVIDMIHPDIYRNLLNNYNGLLESRSVQAITKLYKLFH